MHLTRGRELARGETLFHEGDKARSLYVVRRGRLRAIRGAAGPNPQVLGDIGVGEMAGELAVLCEVTRTATVVGTPEDEPEALITIPLIARDSIKGALNIYRLGFQEFTEDEFMLAVRFGDAAALAGRADVGTRMAVRAVSAPAAIQRVCCRV